MNTGRANGNDLSFWRDEDAEVPKALEPKLTTISPPYSTATSRNDYSRSAAASFTDEKPSTYFHSRRKAKGDIEKPWLKEKNHRQAWLTWFPIIGIILGIGCTGALVWDGLQQNKLPGYCQILDEDFSQGLRDNIWTKEAEVGGYGNGQFEETTTTDENVFIENGMLVIKPTVQDEDLIYKNNVINLIEDKVCTAEGMPWDSCVTSTNTTNGTIVNPVKSGRVNSKKGATIRYGKQFIWFLISTSESVTPLSSTC
jgi:hypothetical protein